jgi:hypothetical protein
VLKLVIVMLLAAAVWTIWRQAQAAVRQWRDPQPDEPPAYRAPVIGLDPASMSWQVTCHARGHTARVSVEHPLEGNWHTWKVDMRQTAASERLDAAMDAAHGLRRHLNGQSPEGDLTGV